MRVSRRVVHGTLTLIWLAIALGAIAVVLSATFRLGDPLLGAIAAYGLLTAVASITGHLRILAGQAGGSLIWTPCVPLLAYFLWALPSVGIRLDAISIAVQLIVVFLLANVFIAWRAERYRRARG